MTWPFLIVLALLDDRIFWLMQVPAFERMNLRAR